MTCPTDAALRAHLDEADVIVRAHVAGCDACFLRMQALSDDARFAARAIADLDDVQVSTADAAEAHAAVARATGARRAVPRRAPLSLAASIVALAVAALVVLTPTGRQAAADLLSGFRAERFEVVTIDRDRPLESFEDLEDVVEVDGVDAHREPQDVDSLAEAAAIAGFTPDGIAAPEGASRSSLRAAAPQEVRLTLRADQAPQLPAGLDGARVIVSLPGMIVATYTVDGHTVISGEAAQLAVDAEGAELADIRAYLLSRPEVPRDLADQLLAIDDWTTTVPIPIPVDEVVWDTTTVDGAPGLQISDPLGSGLLWQVDGHVHALGAEGLDVDVLRGMVDDAG